MMVQRKLRDLRMDESSSVQSYIDEFEEILEEATTLGMDIVKNPEQLALQFLAGLPKSLETFTDVLSLSYQESGKELTPKVVTTALLTHTRTKTSRSDVTPKEDSAMKVDKVDAKCHHCGKKGHFKAECWDVVGKPKDRKGGKKGGRFRKEKGGRRREEANSTSSSSGDWGFSAAAGEGDDETVLAVAEDDWIADSGCSNHICNDRSKLSDYKPFETSVKVASSKVIKTVGVGNLKVIATVGNRKRKTIIHDVYFIPNFPNLISIGQLTARGATVEFSQQGCTFRKNGEVLLVGKSWRKNLWRLEIEPKPDDADQTEDKISKETSAALVINETATADQAVLLHRRLGHASVTAMRRLSADGVIPKINEEDLNKIKEAPCVVCLKGKQHKSPFHDSTSRSSTPLARVHTDLQGPMPVESITRKRYMMAIWDDATNFHWTYALERKSEALETFKVWKTQVEKERDQKVKVLRSDNGGEFTSDAFKAYLEKEGIKAETTIPATPEQNGKVERGNRTLEEKITCLLHDSENLPGDRRRFWVEAMMTATYLINRLPSSPNRGKTPYEAYYEEKPPLAHLRTFGSIAYAHNPDRQKHESKTIQTILLGYGEDHGKKAYRLLRTDTGKIYYSRNVEFDEQLPRNSLGGKMVTLDLTAPRIEEVEEDADIPDVVPLKPPTPKQAKPSWEYVPVVDQDVVDDSGSYGRGMRNRKREVQPEEFVNFVRLAHPDTTPDLAALPEPAVPSSTKEALSSPHSAFWKQAMDAEMESMEANGVWELTELPLDAKAVGGRWVYALKRDKGGKVEKFKARWVAKGYTQRDGIDYNETYAPVLHLNSFRIFLAIAAREDLELRQGDFKTAFLTARLVETVYMDQPTGYETRGEGGKKLVAHLLKAIYGLKQSPLAFANHSRSFFTTIDLEVLEADTCLYVGWKDKKRRMLIQYVDDFAVAASSEKEVDEIMRLTKEAFTIDDRGDLSDGLMLGMEFKRDRSRRTITLSQSRYVKEVLSRFDTSTLRPARTPMDEHKQLMIEQDLSKQDLERVNQSRYLQAVGSLMYLMVCTRPDLAFSVGVVSRFSSDPREIHWSAIHRIFRYLAGTSHLGLVLGGNQEAPLLEMWTDADYAGDHETRRSTTGYVVKLYGSTVVWASRRQRAISKSSTEAEFIALSQGAQNLLWLSKLVSQLGYEVPTIPVHVDNQSAITTTQNGRHSERTKHIDIAYKYGRELHQNKTIALSFCPTDAMTADIFTKALGREKFEKHRRSLGVRDKDEDAAHLIEWEC